MQLSYLLMEKLEASSEIINQTRSVTNQSSYPSVLHPPELDPGLMSVYRDVTIPVNIAILVTSLLGLLGVCRHWAQLLTPWMLAFSVGIISEASVFLYLISEGKVMHLCCMKNVLWENNYSARQVSISTLLVSKVFNQIVSGLLLSRTCIHSHN